MTEAPPTVLWEGDTALAVAKPAGVLVHNSAFSGPRESSLRQQVGQALGRRVYPIHRLDRGTSGVVFFAREAEGVAAWQSALGADACAKVYLAVVRGRLVARARVDRPVKGSDGERRDALSHVEPVCASTTERASLVALRLFTGRHHQARRHCNHLAHPIVNDAVHGDSRFNREFQERTGFSRLGLHAVRLVCQSPDDGALVDVHAPFPDDLASVLGRLFDADAADHAAAVEALVGLPAAR